MPHIYFWIQNILTSDVVFDRNVNVHKGWIITEAKYPRFRVLHGSEHVYYYYLCTITELTPCTPHLLNKKTE